MHTASNTLAHNSFPPYRMNFRKVARLRAAEGLPKRTRGGQPGNRNRLIHGRYSRAILRRKAEANAILRETRRIIALLNLETKWRRFQLSRQAPLTRHLPLVGRSKIHERSEMDFRVGVGARTIFSKTLRFAGSTVAARGTT